MQHRALPAIACLSLCSFVAAHGGQYRGPSGTVPPSSSSGSGSGTPGANANPSADQTGKPKSASPPPAIPGLGGPGAGLGPGSGVDPSKVGGMPIGDDLSRWEYWWEFHKDPFIRLKQSIHREHATGGDGFFMGAGRVVSRDSLRPTRALVLSEVLPSLVRALEDTTQRDVASSCLVAIAKIGRNTAGIDILDLMRRRLRSHDLEIRQTAALAMGITQMPAAIDDLLALASDSERGRALCGRASVDDLTRAFAIYGSGLVAWAADDDELDRRTFEACADLLANGAHASSDVQVAAIHAIGLLRPADTSLGRYLIQRCYALLITDYSTRESGPSHQLVQSHAPTAMAKLLCARPDPLLIEDLHRRMVALLADPDRVAGMRPQIGQSAVIALGMTADSDDVEVSAALRRHYADGADHQTRMLCLIALGQIGGATNQQFLLEALRAGSKALVKPWAAVSLGVLCHERRESGEDIDPEVGKAIQGWLARVKSPSALAGLAIGLGLTGHRDAAPELRALLERHRHKDDLAGYLCVALALMDDQPSVGIITEIVTDSSRRPYRLLQAAVALGKLGDIDAAPTLSDAMASGPANLSRMSALASALGLIGDSRSIAPLTRMLHNDGLTDLTRAFAAVALGGVADKEDLPWNSKIGRGLNYRAAVDSLTNQVNGILDIL